MQCNEMKGGVMRAGIGAVFTELANLLATFTAKVGGKPVNGGG